VSGDPRQRLRLAPGARARPGDPHVAPHPPVDRRLSRIRDVLAALGPRAPRRARRHGPPRRLRSSHAASSRAVRVQAIEHHGQPQRPPRSPVRIDGALAPRLGRWLWLVKWLLAIPHYIVLAFLWLTLLVLTVIAFFAILFTGRYPRGIFDFNLGVLRWTWR